MDNWKGLSCGIISLDGGGIRGIYQAKFLEQFETHPFFDHIDIVAGVSTGAIIAVGISLGFKPSKIFQLYLDLGEDIFLGEKSVSKWLQNGSLYSSEILKKKLKVFCGDKKLGDCFCQTLIVTSVVNNATFKIFDSHNEKDAQIPLLDVLLASTAAPIFFQPHFIESTSATYLDGGIACNNPAMQAIRTALNNNVLLKDIYLLSIGTAHHPEICVPDKIMEPSRLGEIEKLESFSEFIRLLSKKNRIELMGKVKQEGMRIVNQTIRLFEMTLWAGSELVEENCRILLEKENYIRVDNKISGKAIGLDDYQLAVGELPFLAKQDSNKYNEQISTWESSLCLSSDGQ